VLWGVYVSITGMSKMCLGISSLGLYIHVQCWGGYAMFGATLVNCSSMHHGRVHGWQSGISMSRASGALRAEQARPHEPSKCRVSWAVRSSFFNFYISYQTKYIFCFYKLAFFIFGLYKFIFLILVPVSLYFFNFGSYKFFYLFLIFINLCFFNFNPFKILIFIYNPYKFMFIRIKIKK